MSLDRISKLIESLDLDNMINNHINEKEKLLKEAAKFMNRSNRYPTETITEIYEYLSDPYSKTKSIANNIQAHYARMSSEFMQSLFMGK